MRAVKRWQDLAHRTVDDLEATGMRLLLEHRVSGLDLGSQTWGFTHRGAAGELSFDRLVLAAGAVPVRPPIDGLTDLGPADGVHLLHTMPEAFELDATLGEATVRSGPVAVVVGAGYVGVEMAEAMTIRGMQVVVLEQLPQVLPRTLDPSLASDVEGHLCERGVDVRCGVRVRALRRGADVEGARVKVGLQDEVLSADLVLVAIGCGRPSSWRSLPDSGSAPPTRSRWTNR